MAHDGLPAIPAAVEVFDLRDEERRFDVGHGRLVTELDHVPVDVAAAMTRRCVLRNPVVAKPAESIGKGGASHDDGPAVAGRQRLGGVEAKNGGVAQLGDPNTVSLRLGGVGGVLDERKLVAVADGPESRHVGELAVKMHGDDRACTRRDGRFDRARIDESGLRVDVDEDGQSSVEERRIRRRDERHWRRDDLVARADSESLEGHDETHRAARDADDPLLPEKMAESPFERCDARSKRQKHRPERLLERRELGIADVVLVKFDAIHRTKRQDKTRPSMATSLKVRSTSARNWYWRSVYHRRSSGSTAPARSACRTSLMPSSLVRLG